MAVYDRVMRACLILALLLFLCVQLSAQGILQTPGDFYVRGIQKLTEKDYFGAVSELKQAYELDSTDARICRALGFALFHTDDLESSAFYYEKVLSQVSDDWESAARLAVICLSEEIQDYDKAIEYAQLATEGNPSSDLAYYALASAYERAGRLEEAERYYRHFLNTFLDSEYSDEVARALEKLNKGALILTHNVVLENKGSAPANSITALIMIGRDFAEYQKTVLLSVKPGFDVVMSDSVGHKFAEYRFKKLDPGQKIEITLNYLIEITPTVYDIWSPANVTPTVDLAPYLMAESMIESNSEAIISEANIVTTGALDAYEKARKIYDYVINTLTYKVQPESRGAEYALAYPDEADCTEFAALFVALCRASAVPARAVFGFIRLPDKEHLDSSHAWAEFYLDDFGWVPIDPTYGSRYSEEYFARIDADHIALWSPSPLFQGRWSLIVFHSTRDSNVKLSATETADIRKVKRAEPNLELAKLLNFPKVVAELPPLEKSGARSVLLLSSAIIFFLVLVSLLASRRFLR